MTPWVKLDNDYYDHRKFAEAGPLVELLWVRMLAWSHRNLTDGVVPVRAIKRLCDFLNEVGEILPPEPHDDPFDAPKCREMTWHDLVTEGEAAGLFEPVDGGASMRVHGYTEKQNTADLVAARRDAGRRGGIKSGEARQKWQPKEANVEATGEQEAKQNEANGQADGKQVLNQMSDVRFQISDTNPPPPSNGLETREGQPEEEEAATPRSPMLDAARLHAMRALKAQPAGSVKVADSWRQVAVTRWLSEHIDEASKLTREDPTLDGPGLLALIERPTTNPGYRMNGPPDLPEVTDSGRRATEASIAEIRAKLPHCRKSSA